MHSTAGNTTSILYKMPPQTTRCSARHQSWTLRYQTYSLIPNMRSKFVAGLTQDMDPGQECSTEGLWNKVQWNSTLSQTLSIANSAPNQNPSIQKSPLYFFFSVRLLSVLCGHSIFFIHATTVNDLRLLSQIILITVFLSYLNSWEETVFPFLMLSAKQGKLLVPFL